jgi:biotin transport system substrate-specific component
MQRTLTLRSIFWPKVNSFSNQLLLVLLGTVVLSLAAQISIPFQPVPLTFQSVTVILLGMGLGARLGGYTIGLYLALGALGLPVFANFSSGIYIFAGPTAGYLIAFLPAAVISGYFTQRGFAKTFLGSFSIALAGTVIIFTGGISFLAQLIGWHNAFLFGVMPFVISEPLKLFALSFVAPRFWK